MQVSDAINLLTIIISVLGILIGFLLLFLQLIPDRKRQLKNIYIAKQIDLSLQDISEIQPEEKFIQTLQKVLDEQKIKIKILGKTISLIIINLSVFVYTIALFILSLSYVIFLINYNGSSIDGIVVNLIVVLTVFDYILLVPMVYLSCVKDYEIDIKAN